MRSRLLPSFALSCLTLFCLSATLDAQTLKPYLPAPNEGQLKWHEMEMYAFVHFTINTFTGKEWGYGDESPELFNPTEYNPDQVVGEIARTGFKGLVLTAKHHDGFCLWPTKTTGHSVANIPWQKGKGDVVRDYALACKKHGIAFGIYVSPWDRNHPDYGTDKYLKIYQAQLKELLTSYGPLFIVWHDGANGGDGYYGGKREKRSIDAATYYKWPETWAMVKKLQPKACIFSDVGPDIRWVGNEHGEAGVPCWATYTPESNREGKAPAPGVVRYQQGVNGTVNGKYWMPAEVDVSIRPGWFWHEAENSKVRTPEQLMGLYMQSVGRGADLNLNIPPDTRGILHEKDVASLKGFKILLDRMYANDYAKNAQVSADSSLANPENLLDGNAYTYWAPKELKGSVEIKLPEMRQFDVIRLKEPIQLGQRVRNYEVQVMDYSGAAPEWKSWQKGQSIGARAIVRSGLVKTDRLKITVEGETAANSLTKTEIIPALSEISLYRYPQSLQAPAVSVAADGKLLINATPGTIPRYTLDGSTPTEKSPIYSGDITLPLGGHVKAISWHDGQPSEMVEETLPVAKTGWKIKAENSASPVENLIDGNNNTLWHTHGQNGEIPPPQSIEIDMGQQINVAAVTVTPRQDGNTKGIPDQYEIYASQDGVTWNQPIAKGEFSNIKSNPVTQTITLPTPTATRYLKITLLRSVDGNHVSLAELGVIAFR